MSRFCNNNSILLIFQLAMMSMLVDVAPKFGCLSAAVKLHNRMLNGVLRCPMDFFDRTPIGRILARFSKDIQTLDNDLPMVIYSVEYCLFSVNFFIDKFCIPLLVLKTARLDNMTKIHKVYTKHSSCE